MQFVIERQLFLANTLEYNAEDYYIVNAELQGDFNQALFRTDGFIERVANFGQIVPAVDAPVIVAGFQPMNIAEIALYKKGLNAAQNKIVHNYLAVKYGLDITDGENSIKLYQNTEYTEALIGVGKDLYIDETTQQEHRSASGEGLQIDVRSPLAVGDYVLAAHNGAEVDDPANWKRYWNVEVTGSAPNVDLSFNFEAAGVTPPAGLSSLKLYYSNGESWTDLGLAPVGGDGKVSFAVDAIQSGQYALGVASPGTAVQAIDQSDHLSVFPNPVNEDELTLRLDNAVHGNAVIHLFDHLGRLVMERRVNKTGVILKETLSLKGLPNGFYTLSVVQNGQHRAVKKIVKQ